MPSFAPYQGLSNTRLTNLMNTDNNLDRKEGIDFTFGVPEAITPDAEGRNTKVTITPVEGTSYPRAQDLTYARLGLDALTRLPNGMEPGIVDIAALPFTIHFALPQINAALGLNLTTDEVVDELHEELAPTYELKIAPGSLAWLEGSTFQFRARINGQPIPLDQVITITDLDGLYPPA